MNNKVLGKIQKNLNKSVINAANSDNKLALTFKEKVLLVSKKKVYYLVAREDISTVCLNCIVDSVMKKIDFDGVRIHLTFAKEGTPDFSLSFKASDIVEE